MLVGNKVDLSDSERKVPLETAVRFAKKMNISAVFEVSAKSSTNVDDAFYRSLVNCVDSFDFATPNEESKTGGR